MNSPNKLSKLSKIVDNYITKNDISLRDFAKQCDLSHSYVAKLRKGYDPITKKTVVPSIDTIEKLAKGMNMDLEYLLTMSKYLDDDKEQSDLVEESSEIYTFINRNKANVLANDIIDILIETGTITKEELKSDSLTPEKREKLYNRIKKIIQISQELDNLQ